MKKALKYFQRASCAKARFHQKVKRIFSSFNPNGTGGLTALEAL